MRPEPALVVVAGAWDAGAREFAARHARHGTVLLTPRDLSRRGWRFRLGDPATTVAIAGDRPLGTGDIRAVLTRLPAVSEADLPHIAAGDRAYVAAEMTAFLLAFLSSLAVPVVNRPTTTCLCGPGWGEARWRQVASGLGLPVTPARQQAVLGAALPEPRCGATVTVVGDTCIGTEDATLAAAARSLAEAAGADLLGVELEHAGAGAAVLRAHLLPDLGDARVASAVLGLFGLPAERPA